MSEGGTQDAAMASLTNASGTLEVNSMLRKSTTFPMPETGLVIKIDLLANRLTKCYRTTQSEGQKKRC